ncbi:transcriptional regulator [Enterococcus sp. JM4C]|uniref:ROK family protein n=1 Tax=Candidatus Enterococcus huntleyi TaxID=1857217 RepID=UPI00137A20B6|nr:ROK family protein [Enterococcus sp. JM4C]KAF1299496.1 transcriptional regulator [Enterococcus sp. JM4C]
MFLCFDVGGTFVKYGRFDRNGQELEKGKFKTLLSSKEAFIDSLVDQINIADTQNQLQGIGLSFPGFVNTETGEAILAGALTELHGENIYDLLNERLAKTYPMVIENDANCAALAENFGGNATQVSDFALITLGTGIGGAIVVDNQILHGHSYRTGELGMMVTDYHHSEHKTLHELASTSALVTKYRELKGIDSAQEVLGETIVSELSDERVKQMVQEWAQFVAITVFNTVVMLNPEKVLIGGGISQSQEIIALINEELQKNRHWPDFEVPVEACHFFNDSGLIGAYYLIKQKVEEEIK